MKRKFKKSIWALLSTVVITTTTLGGSFLSYAETGPGIETGTETGHADELNGVWISYLILNELPKDEAGFKAAVNQMFDNCKSWGMNAVFVHARSHGDAMYPSDHYPWSKFVTGKQGQAINYDPFAYMVQAAHERGLQIHAWFNPYRITGYLMPWEEVSDQSPAKRWLNDNDTSNDRWVLKHDDAYYYNPSVKQVKDMVIQGVLEVVNHYEVDGIHFDDYFYPVVDDNQETRWFDKPEYLASGAKNPLWQWRRDQVSELVYGINQAIKGVKPNVLFGVSPQGYAAHLRSQSELFVDIDRWMSQDGYVDYIMPQLYWGFETKNSLGELTPYAFENNLNTWTQLKRSGHVTLYLGLGMYRAGNDVKDYNEVSEWLRYQDIIKRQVEMGRSRKEVSGFCFYSYDSFLQPEAQSEVSNLLPLLR